MSKELSESFRALSDHTRLQKQEQRERRIASLFALRGEGFDIREVTPYQFRVNHRLDIFPTWAKWHDVATNKRGGFKGTSCAAFVRQFFGSIQ